MAAVVGCWLGSGGARPLSLIGSSRRGNLLRRLPIPAPHLPPPPPPPCITQGRGEREHAGAHERDCITFQADRRAHPGAGPRLRASYVPGGQKNSPPAGGAAGGLERFTLCITQRRGPNPIAGCCLLCCVRVGFPLCGTTRSLILSCRARSVNPWWTLRARFLSVSGVCVIHRPPELQSWQLANVLHLGLSLYGRYPLQHVPQGVVDGGHQLPALAEVGQLSPGIRYEAFQLL